MSSLSSRRHLLLQLAALAVLPYASAADTAPEGKIEAPNVVIISELLATSGQPTKSSLEKLGALGYQDVINLAPHTVPDAVKEEPEMLQKQGISYLNIPINFSEPSAADVAAFTAAMKKLDGRKVLVHCQVNMRASSMVFLYRAIHQAVPVDKAYEGVSKVWYPNRTWRKMITAQLKENGILFEAF